jgi:metal-responsive CopG/Arc/MetJ family transcriptional regulator
MTARRSKTKFTQIHVSIPVRLLEDLDDSLAFNQSRSKVIAQLVKNHLDGADIDITMMTKKQVIISLMNKVEYDSPEFVMLNSLLQIFSK